MDKKYLAFNFALLFWLLALVAWYLSDTLLTGCFTALSFTSFLTHGLRTQVMNMFKKNKDVENKQAVINPTPAPVADKDATVAEKSATTIIACDVRVDGNIVAAGHVYIHGTLFGNIDAKDKMIKVMRSGMVEGNIVCQELIVDGNVVGQCSSDTIEICEHGNVNGTLSYRTLSMKKGGIFTGKAETLPPLEQKNNAVGIVKETNVEIKEPIATEQTETEGATRSQAKKSQREAG